MLAEDYVLRLLGIEKGMSVEKLATQLDDCGGFKKGVVTTVIKLLIF